MANSNVSDNCGIKKKEKNTYEGTEALIECEAGGAWCSGEQHRDSWILLPVDQ